MNQPHHVFPAEFIRHASICNQFNFGKRPTRYNRYKRLFYKLKTEFLKRYGTLQSYHYQSFNSWFCGDCYERVTDREMDRCSGRNCGGNWAGQHEHILACYGFSYMPDADNGLFPNHPNVATFHVPMNEFRYQGTVHRTESANFAYYRNRCIGKIGLKEEVAAPEGVNPFESLKWLIRYCQQNNMIPVRIGEPKELPF